MRWLPSTQVYQSSVFEAVAKCTHCHRSNHAGRSINPLFLRQLPNFLIVPGMTYWALYQSSVFEAVAKFSFLVAATIYVVKYQSSVFEAVAKFGT